MLKLATLRNTIIFIALSLAMFIWAHFDRIQTEDMIKHMGQTTGRTISAKIFRSAIQVGKSMELGVKIEFEADGKSFVIERRLNAVRFGVGDIVPIIYDKRNPGGLTTKVRRPEGVWIEYYFKLVSGALFGIIGLVLLFLQKRKRYQRR